MYTFGVIIFSLIVGYSAGKNKEKKKNQVRIRKLEIDNAILMDPNSSIEEIQKRLEENELKHNRFRRIWKTIIDWAKP